MDKGWGEGHRASEEEKQTPTPSLSGRERLVVDTITRAHVYQPE